MMSSSPEIRAMPERRDRQPRDAVGPARRNPMGRKSGCRRKVLSDCHGDAVASMKGVAARYPAFDAVLARPLDLEQRINRCRTEHQRAEPLAWESEDLLALTAFIARQSRGLPIAVATGPELHPFLDLGKETVPPALRSAENLSCSQCHDDNWGKRLAGSVISARAPDRLPDLSPRMAEPRLAAAPTARLHDRRARAALRLWRFARPSPWNFT